MDQNIYNLIILLYYIINYFQEILLSFLLNNKLFKILYFFKKKRNLFQKIYCFNRDMSCLKLACSSMKSVIIAAIFCEYKSLIIPLPAVLASVAVQHANCLKITLVLSAMFRKTLIAASLSAQVFGCERKVAQALLSAAWKLLNKAG